MQTSNLLPDVFASDPSDCRRCALTLPELISTLERSGRHLTARTARNWWSNGILPRPERAGLGQGGGTVTYWKGDGGAVLRRAEIAHDLLSQRFGVQRTAAGLWLAGFAVPLETVQLAFKWQIEEYGQRVLGRSENDFERGLWDLVGGFVRQDARIRGGLSEDCEGEALYALTGELLELLCGVGDGIPDLQDAGQWAEDLADELLDRINFLAPLAARYRNPIKVPDLRVEDVKDLLLWIGKMASLRRQREAVAEAKLHDWVRARRVVRMLIGQLDRAFNATSPQKHIAHRALFTRLAVVWGFVLFPILLAVVKAIDERRQLTRWVLQLAVAVRRGPREARPQL